MQEIAVRDVMTAPALTVHADAGFKQVVELISRHRVSALPVVDEHGRPLGVVSEADLLVKEEGADERGRLLELPRRRRQRAKARAATARELMTAPALTVAPDVTLPEAARRMREARVKRLVVVDEEGRVVGVVSRVDVLRVFLRPDDAIREDIQRLVRDVFWMEEGTVQVHVDQGVVRLDGRLDLRSDAEALRALAGRLAGVVAVEGTLTYMHDDTRHPSSAAELWFHPEFSVRSVGD